MNKANPISILLSSSLMLDHLNLKNDAQRIRDALWKTVSEGDGNVFLIILLPNSPLVFNI